MEKHKTNSVCLYLTENYGRGGTIWILQKYGPSKTKVHQKWKTVVNANTRISFDCQVKQPFGAHLLLLTAKLQAGDWACPALGKRGLCLSETPLLP